MRSTLLADGMLGHRSQTFVLMSTLPNDVLGYSGSLSLVCHRLLHELSFSEYFLHFRVGGDLLVVSKTLRYCALSVVPQVIFPAYWLAAAIAMSASVIALDIKYTPKSS